VVVIGEAAVSSVAMEVDVPSVPRDASLGSSVGIASPTPSHVIVFGTLRIIIPSAHDSAGCPDRHGGLP